MTEGSVTRRGRRIRPAAALIAEGVGAQREQPPGERDPRDLRLAALGDPFRETPQRRISARVRGGLHEHPAQPPRALLADLAAPDVLGARPLGRRQASPRTESVGRAEADHGGRISRSDLFGAGGRGLLEGASLPASSAARVAANRRLSDALDVEVASAEHELRERFGGDPRIGRLTPIPGIGFLTAATILAP